MPLLLSLSHMFYRFYDIIRTTPYYQEQCQQEYHTYGDADSLCEQQSRMFLSNVLYSCTYFFCECHHRSVIMYRTFVEFDVEFLSQHIFGFIRARFSHCRYPSHHRSQLQTAQSDDRPHMNQTPMHFHRRYWSRYQGVR